MQQIPIDPLKIVQVGMMVPYGTPEPTESRVQRVIGVYRSLNATVVDAWKDGNQNIAVSYEVCPDQQAFAEYLQADLVKALNGPDTRAAHAVVQFRGMVDPDDPAGAKRDIALVTLIEKCPAFNHDILMFQSAELVAASFQERTPWWKFWK